MQNERQTQSNNGLISINVYPATCSIGRDTKFTAPFSNGFLSRGFTDRREILHSGSATSRTGLRFWGDGPGDGRILGVKRGHMAGYMLLAEALVCSFF